MSKDLRIATPWAAAMLLGLGVLLPALAPAATVAELSALARQSTFEVVLPKIEPEHVKYEKPLPLELLSFTERNDKFWSIGTAFAIAPEVFVSNAHVLTSGIGSPLGRPHLRDSDGRTFPIDRILKFSLHEDYVVFRARGATAGRVLVPGTDTPVGATVYAAGNALGEGVVLRDGLLTSLTPEDQDGRWKWLRFSAAASPGNSGGPLLDETGRVIGVVTARSPGENLNYALPIARVLEGSERTATIDMRSSFGLPILRQQIVTEYQDEFALPASWEDFTHRLLESGERQYTLNQEKLLQQYVGALPPGGKSSRLLASLERGIALALIGQQADDSWGLTQPSGEEEIALADASLRVGSFDGAFSFLWQRDDGSVDPAIHRDSTAFMDALLKGIRLPRVIGTQAIRITSLGAPQHQSLHTDRFDRTWQLRSWPLGYADLQVVTLALPLPDGYAGLFLLAPMVSYSNSIASLRLMADYAHVEYTGSAAQWRSFLGSRELCPPWLRELRFGQDTGLALQLPGLDVNMPASLLALKDESSLSVYPGYAIEAGRLIARPAGVVVNEGPKHDDTTWVGIWSQPRPAGDAGSELLKRWREMSARGEGFDGKPGYNSSHTQFWTIDVVGDPAGDMLYEVTLTLYEKSLLPRQVNERRERLLEGLTVKETMR